MPYQDDQATLEARRDELRRDLDEAARKVEALVAATSEQERLGRELASVEARLERAAQGRRLPLLDNLRVASPCNVSWEAMTGDDRVRFCGSCEKDVYNLSALARAEAEALLAKHGSSICVRLYQRADGTVLTADCPVGVRRKRVRRGVLAAASAGALAAAASTTFATQGSPVAVTVGRVVVEPPVGDSAAVRATAAPKPSPVPPRPEGKKGAPPSPEPEINRGRP
jgi:hypothetical protein